MVAATKGRIERWGGEGIHDFILREGRDSSSPTDNICIYLRSEVLAKMCVQN